MAAHRCLYSVFPLTLFDWKSVYSADEDTKKILTALRINKPSAVPADVIQSVHMSYRHHLKKGHIVLLGEKLLLFKPINMNTKLIFFDYSSTLHLPQVIWKLSRRSYWWAHGGGYTTLYRLILRFFWSGLREEINKWVAVCTHCVSYNI